MNAPQSAELEVGQRAFWRINSKAEPRVVRITHIPDPDWREVELVDTQAQGFRFNAKVRELRPV